MSLPLLRARDILTAHVVSVDPDVTVGAIAKLMLERGVSALPVVDREGQLVGIVSEGDLMHREETGTEPERSWWLRPFLGKAEMAREYAHAHGRRARDVMTREVVTIGEDTPIAEIAALLDRHRIKRVPVLREGRVVGIVSRANLLQALAMAVGAETQEAAAGGDDGALRGRLLAKLQGQAWLDMSLKNIMVREGVVHLWGIARSRAEADALRIAVANVPGVRKVEDHLCLKPVTLF